MSTYQIHVYCDGRVLRGESEPRGSHADKRAHVARLAFYPSGEVEDLATGDVDSSNLASPRLPFDLWVPHRVSSMRYNQLRSMGLAEDEVQRPLVSETVAESGGLLDLEAIAQRNDDYSEFDTSHLKFVLRCSLCGLDFQFRQEKLSPYLDKLRAARWDSVSLSALGAVTGD